MNGEKEGPDLKESSYLSPWEEHHFWLKILYDHAHFVRDYLSPAEKEYVRLANDYIDQFAYLRKRLRKLNSQLTASSPEMIDFARSVHLIAYGYFTLESNLQYLRLRNKVNLNLTPTFLTGTLLENQEYLRILGYLTCGYDAPPLSLNELLDLWLEDQAGHASLLANGLDPLEANIINKSNVLAKTFLWYLYENEKIKQMGHFTEEPVPQQAKFVRDVILSVNEFNQLVILVLKEYKDNQLFNRLTYRFLEHHLPETCYFLKKLSYYTPEDSDIIPNCELVRPYF
jgi:hypothetical protein